MVSVTSISLGQSECKFLVDGTPAVSLEYPLSLSFLLFRKEVSLLLFTPDLRPLYSG